MLAATTAMEKLAYFYDCAELRISDRSRSRFLRGADDGQGNTNPFNNNYLRHTLLLELAIKNRPGDTSLSRVIHANLSLLGSKSRSDWDFGLGKIGWGTHFVPGQKSLN